MRKARKRGRLNHYGETLPLYQDFLSFTLQQRWALRSLLDALRARGAVYWWKFPFGLSATLRGKTAQLHFPEDVKHFCEFLRLPQIELPEWSAGLGIQGQSLMPARTTSAKPQRAQHRRTRSTLSQTHHTMQIP